MPEVFLARFPDAVMSQPPFPSAARENPLVPRVGLDGICRIISRLLVKASFKMTLFLS